MTVAAPLDALADHEQLDAPAHVEPPGGENCAGAHNHLFCQVVARTLVGSWAPARVASDSQPVPTSVVSLPNVRERGPAGPAFLTDSVVPRGPPLA